METILPLLGIPIALSILWIGESIAFRIRGEEASEARSLRRENAKLANELRKYRQAEKPEIEEPETVSTTDN